MLLFIPPAGGQAQQAGFTFQHLTVEDGLSSNTVLSILQDRRGFMWFGTSEGLDRYDGYNFTSYRHDPADSASISENFIWFESLYEDRDGMIWVGTKTGGLNRFDPVTETFTRFLHDPNDPSSLSSNNNLSLFGDRSGTFWIGTDKGLNRFERATESFTRFQHDPLNPASLVHNNVWEIHETGRGREASLWIATYGGLDRFDRKTGTFEHIKLEGLDPKNGQAGPITDLYGDQHGTLWIGSGFGLVRLDLQTMTPAYYRHDPDNENSLNFPVITDIWQHPGSGGRVLWLTTRRGLNRFDTQTETFSHYAYDPAKPQGLQATAVEGLCEDRTQQLWVGSYSEGINRLNGPDRNFGLMRHDAENPNSLQGWGVNAIHEDRHGVLWLGTEIGLNRWDRAADRFTWYRFDDDTTGIWGTNVIRGIAEDGAGNLWLGTRGGGLIRFDPQTGDFRQYRHDPADASSLAGDAIGSVYMDKSGALWLDMREHVLSRLLPEDQEAGRFTHFNPATEDTMGIENLMGFAFLEDSYDELWVGSHLSGLFRFDRETGNFTAYRHDPEDEITLSSNIVKSIYETRTGSDTALWIGTDHGLNRFERRTGSFRRIYNQQPGGSDFIISMTGDQAGNLWMQNQKGISKYDIRQGIFTNYAGSHGLPADMSNAEGCFGNDKGELFFGGMGGLIYFHPDSILSNARPPPVVLTGFSIRNQPAELDSSITLKRRIDLAHDQNFFSFEFAALDYTEAKKNQFAYMLEGLDGDWIASGRRRFANYTAVRPGTYVFRVKGSNNDGVWNEDGASIVIRVHAPWWQSVWAYLVYAALFLAGLYSVRRFELRRLQLRNALRLQHMEALKLKEIDRLKSRFFAGISHEFRTPLTLILGPVEKWLPRLRQAEMRADFHIVQRSARRLEKLIVQLLDLSRLEAGRMALRARPENIVVLARMITMTFESLAKQRGINLQFHAAQEEIIAYVERDKLEVMITNVLANAFKFTDAGGRIRVLVAPAAGRGESDPRLSGAAPAGSVAIRISDSGAGIPAHQLGRIFDRFHQVDSASGREGSGIGLALTKELVELHGGEIAAHSEIGKGSTFIITLRLGKAHLRASQIVESGPTAPAPPAAKRAQSLPGEERPLVLIVEDNPDMRAYLRGNLQEAYRIVEAGDATQGIRQARSNAPDLIVSDVMMPGMDGFELCRKLKTEAQTSHIPVILLTARAGQEDKLHGLETGADDYLIKPFNTNELRTRARNLIVQRRNLRERFRRELVTEPSQLAATSMDEAFLTKVLAAVEAKIGDASYETDDLARAVAIGRRHLNRKLRALTGHSVRGYIRTIRLKRAGQLLRQQAGTVTEIAYQVGFNSLAHFAKVFRAQFGVTPSAYAARAARTSRHEPDQPGESRK